MLSESLPRKNWAGAPVCCARIGEANIHARPKIVASEHVGVIFIIFRRSTIDDGRWTMDDLCRSIAQKKAAADHSAAASSTDYRISTIDYRLLSPPIAAAATSTPGWL